MNPCRACVKVYTETPCNSLGHCIFEGTDEKPVIQKQGPDYIPKLSAVQP